MAADDVLVGRLAAHGDRIAVTDARGALTYDDLLSRAREVARALLQQPSFAAGERVVFLVSANTDYVITLVGIWLAGGMAVPIRPGVPGPEIDYTVSDAEPVVFVVDAANADAAAGRGLPVMNLSALADTPAVDLPDVAADDPALMLYTSGTTGRPKGVVHTHRSIAAQVTSLIEAWEWSAEDRILLVLPLHHIHGIVNVICCALWSGAVCEMAERFDPAAVWERFTQEGLTLFMAVPTIYHRLVEAWSAADESTQQRWSEATRTLRLMVSGSAALPVSTLERWQEITGHVLLERYGMTEIGMGLSNTLAERVPGSVGYPLPGVEVRVVDDDGSDIDEDGVAGELLVRGERLFTEYWRRPDATREAFDGNWFRTGDVVVREEGRYRILGRASVDIIKTGGEKVSALEVEEVFRTHDGIADCAVVGVADDEWGERVCAAVVAGAGGDLDATSLRAWGKERLADYKVPREFLEVDELPRNAMGKVVKADVAKLFDAG